MSFFGEHVGYYASWFYIIVLLTGQFMYINLDDERHIIAKYILSMGILFQFLIFLKYTLYDLPQKEYLEQIEEFGNRTLGSIRTVRY